MLPALATLIALQAIDSATDARRKRLAELPAAEQALADAAAAAMAAVDDVRRRLAANHDARLALDKDVAVMDARLARFDEHKAAVKTNLEYTALLHEIATARSEKEALEDRLLVLMMEADALTAELRAAQRTLADEEARSREAHAALAAERAALDRALEDLARDRAREARELDAAVLARYNQLLKQRKGIAVTRMTGDVCEACHVRLRPHVAQQVRRNDSLVACDSCQRLLYFDASAARSQP